MTGILNPCSEPDSAPGAALRHCDCSVLPLNRMHQSLTGSSGVPVGLSAQWQGSSESLGTEAGRRQGSKVFQSRGMEGVQMVAGTSALLDASEASVKFSSCTHAQGCSGRPGSKAGWIWLIQVRTRAAYETRCTRHAILAFVRGLVLRMQLAMPCKAKKRKKLPCGMSATWKAQCHWPLESQGWHTTFWSYAGHTAGSKIWALA